ncbi:MAG: hypothetical protein KJ025_20050 [Burkholderiales bacterium]|nr:hypothetical protein [Burkholderiales bacterium]
MVTRRQFLQVGAGGAAVLALARLGHARTAPRTAAPLGAGAREVLAAVVPVILDGALPAAPAARAARVAATIERIGQTVAGLPPHLRAEIGELFALLAFAPSRWLIAGVRAPWREASMEEIAAFLTRWRQSGWSLLRQGYLALHELVLAAHYGDAASWRAIGYPGPPSLG